jgi:tetratricopeptide (TPR) repeat protein
VSGDNARVLELRRRVQADPASIAFAQLAEECRRTGANAEAVDICRAGLSFHPDYLSARVTLGRALVELGRFDEAQTELLLVLKLAPDNLPANRAIAEMYQKRGDMADALNHYKRALELAKYDPDLEHQVERIENVVSPQPPPAPPLETAPSAIEDLFDFDTLLQQLGGRTQSTPETPSETDPPPAPVVITPGAIDAVQLQEDDSDPFAFLERQLRESDEQRTYEEVAAHVDDDGEQRALGDLEDWLSAIVADRDNRPSA